MRQVTFSEIYEAIAALTTGEWKPTTTGELFHEYGLDYCELPSTVKDLAVCMDRSRVAVRWFANGTQHLDILTPQGEEDGAEGSILSFEFAGEVRSY